MLGCGIGVRTDTFLMYWVSGAGMTIKPPDWRPKFLTTVVTPYEYLPTALVINLRTPAYLQLTLVVQRRISFLRASGATYRYVYRGWAKSFEKNFLGRPTSSQPCGQD